MHLLDIPDEILEDIAFYLDTDSLAAFASSNPRLQQVSRSTLQAVRIKKIAESTRDWLSANGPFVRGLDFSNSVTPWAAQESLIRLCPHITELSLVNSGVAYAHRLDIFNVLKNLETLRMTAPSLGNSRLVDSGSFTSVKKLYIEVGTEFMPLMFTANLMIACTALEVFHINLIGTRVFEFKYDSLPQLPKEHWTTLNTVVCARHRAPARNSAKFLLGSIFANNSTPGIPEWIEEDRECYIYEHGVFNGASSTAVDNGSVKLQKQFHFVDLADPETFEPRWGSPKWLRITGFTAKLDELNGFEWTRLTNLDMTTCHSNFGETFRENLITSSPNLRIIACGLCFLVPMNRTTTWNGRGRFVEALQRLRLRKLQVRGLCLCRDSMEQRYRVYDSRCLVCSESLESANLIDFGGFRYLEELTLHGFDLESSAFSRLTNSHVRSVSLCLNRFDSCSGLGTFMKSCGKLKYFKLEGFNLELQSEQLWDSLAEGHNLAQLCLRAGLEARDGHNLTNRVRTLFLQLLQGLDFLHLHSPDRTILDGLCDPPAPSIPSRLRKKVDIFYHTFYFKNVSSCAMGECFIGSSLCCSDTSAGSVPLAAWNVK